VDSPDLLGTLLAAVFLLSVPVYLVVGVPLCFWRARRRARQGRFTPRWAWGVSSAFVAGPALLLGVLVAYDLATNPASTQLALLLCSIPLVPVLVWAMHWWLAVVSGWRWPWS
jgi:hypothetical protein